ncbi:MAG: hypothetical protein ACFCVH_05940 [Alphaproteobacteria bacterium]
MSAPEPFAIEGASASVWRTAPSLHGRRTAAIGRFACADGPSGTALLARIAATLAAERFGALLGPMDGDTWHSYRLVTESDGRPPFAMEPTNPPHYADAFLDAGFRPIARYVSSIDTIVAPESPVLDRQRRLAIRGFRIEAADDELRLIHDLSMRAFAGNPFFDRLSWPGFHALYAPVVPLIDPRLVLFAEAVGGSCVGFLFAIPEPSAPATVVLKSYASLRRGAGGLLGEAFYRNARARGTEAVIHALMHEDNLSLRHSGKRHGRVFRRYALLGRMLAA